MDRGFIVLLLLISATGLALAGLARQRGHGVLLALHLGCVMALFLTLPYGKFAHGIFRSAACSSRPSRNGRRARPVRPDPGYAAHATTGPGAHHHRFANDYIKETSS
jgi:citrate/tricarballylate utilization protein